MLALNTNNTSFKYLAFYAFILALLKLDVVTALRCNYCVDFENKCRQTSYTIDCADFDPCSFESVYQTYKHYYPADINILIDMFARDKGFDVTSIEDKAAKHQNLTAEEIKDIPPKIDCNSTLPRVCIKEHFYTGTEHRTRKGCGVLGQMLHCMENRKERIFECYECGSDLCNNGYQFSPLLKLLLCTAIGGLLFIHVNTL